MNLDSAQERAAVELRTSIFALRVCVDVACLQRAAAAGTMADHGFSAMSTITSKQFIAGSANLLSKGSRSLGITGRNLAKVAVTMYYMYQGKEIEMQNGDHYVNISGPLSLKDYKKLEDDPGLALAKISYCQRSLSGSLLESTDKMPTMLKGALKGRRAMVKGVQDAKVEELKQMKDLINHDFLVIELRPGAYPEAQSIFIMAHKVAQDGDEGAGIYVKYLKPSELKSVYHEDVQLYAIECKTKLGLNCIIELLTKEGADYSVRDANCWDYARNTTKCLLKECVERAKSASEKARLQKELDNLSTNLRNQHIIDTAVKVRDWISAQIASM